MSKTSNDEGNVLVEFIGVIVALLVPISIIAGACVSIAQSYLATDVSARTASRAFVVSSSEARARTNSKSAALVALNDLDTASALVAISCSKTPCLTPGSYVTVKVSRKVKLQLPMKLGARSIFVSAQHTAVVDELRTP
jgi:hypothetical protein